MAVWAESDYHVMPCLQTINASPLSQCTTLFGSAPYRISLKGLITKTSYDNVRIWQWFMIIIWQT